MNKYENYREFLADLIIWGDCACRPQISDAPNQSGACPPQVSDGPDQSEAFRQNPFSPKEAFFALLQKSSESAKQDIFSPFLYLTLSARLEWPEMMLLAAALYTGLKGESLTPALWQLFYSGEKANSPGLELYYQSAPLLYEREWREDILDIHLRISPRIFLFLKGILTEPMYIPGMDWYYREEIPGMDRYCQKEISGAANRNTSGKSAPDSYCRQEQALPYLGKSIRLYEKIALCISEIPGRKLVYLHGPKGSGRKLNYAYLAARFQMDLAVIPLSQLESLHQLRDIQTECLINHAMFVIELPDHERNLLPFLNQLQDEETVFLLGSKPNLPKNCQLRRQYLPFSIQQTDVLGDKELFERLTLSYQWEEDKVRTDFLNRYNFLPGRMREILELAKSYSLSAKNGRITGEQLKQAILGVSSHSLDQYAKKIRTIYCMKDLILPDLPRQKLLHIISRIRNRKLVYEEWGFLEKSAYGNGVSMIFAGPPGTGKTMAAQVMAKELGMELYRVELPAVVDKYIGETEKKLNRIFGEAEKTMAILFFDEADVLFSKRTEIKESNDKYSNMEIAFLLQKMEEYEGVSILATNYLQNFDGAFRRRVSDIIDFPLPDAPLRRQMWQSMIPSKLPISDEIDFRFLGEQFEVSGSTIKNALIYASFLAAEAPKPLLTMERILKGLSHELEKSGKKLSRKEYGEYGHLF